MGLKYIIDGEPINVDHAHDKDDESREAFVKKGWKPPPPRRKKKEEVEASAPASPAQPEGDEI